MPFRFPLATLLRFRCSVEHQKELLLEAANRQLAELRRSLERLKRTQEYARFLREHELETGAPGSFLHFDLACESVLNERRRALEVKIAQAEELCAERVDAYRRAHRDREILESLREEQLHGYSQAKARREQRDLDDLLIMRRELGRRG